MTLRATFGAWFRAPFILLLSLGLLLIPATPATVAAQEAEYQRFSVEVTGEGPDVILIPGLATPRDVWQPTARELASRYRLHLVQVRGFGEDAGINAEGPVLEPMVEELARYIAQEGLQKPAIVGHSMGGLAALMLGVHHPELPGRLMIVDALPWFGVLAAPGQEVTMETIEPQAAALRNGMIATYGQDLTSEQLAAQVQGQVLDPAHLPQLTEWAGRADPRVAGQLAYDDLTTDMRQEIALITAPVTVVFPWNETYPPRAQAEPFYRAQYAALPAVETVGVGAAGHFLMLDQPAAFLQALEGFLTE
jgi:pimeloyl-ACP methyl ester carboxylesterase